MADLPNSYVYRAGQREVIPVDLQKLLYSYKPQYDLALKPYDRVVIPFKQFFVIVTGGVNRPGPYPYVPEKTYEYYLDLAGGVNPDLGKFGDVKITDSNYERIDRQSVLGPESRIQVPYSFSYFFFKYFPIIVSSTSAVVSILVATGVIN